MKTPVELPTATPAGGSYAEAQTVTLACGTEGAKIHYTIDGSNPTASSTEYSGPIPIDATTTIKAKAYNSGINSPSEIMTETYTITV